MLIYDGVFSWSGWGGRLSLGSGKCRLRIHDLSEKETKGIRLLKPIIAIVSDVPDSKMSVKSCTSHIATLVVERFKIDPHRMLWLEYYPENRYGVHGERLIPEHFEAVEFDWHLNKAIKPKWRDVKSPILDEIRSLL